jgi:hypothetical protein
MIDGTHSKFAQSLLNESARLADRLSNLVIAVFDAAKNLVAGFEQRLKALRFAHVEGDAAYAANETGARARHEREPLAA